MNASLAFCILAFSLTWVFGGYSRWSDFLMSSKIYWYRACFSKCSVDISGSLQISVMYANYCNMPSQNRFLVEKSNSCMDWDSLPR